MQTLPRKRLGRPPLDPDDPSVAVHFRLPAKQYDAMLQRANRARESLGDYIRRRVLFTGDAPAEHDEP